MSVLNPSVKHPVMGKKSAGFSQQPLTSDVARQYLNHIRLSNVLNVGSKRYCINIQERETYNVNTEKN